MGTDGPGGFTGEAFPVTEPEPTAVERLLRAERDPASDETFRVTGVMMQYLEICERELWFESRDIEIDRENPSVVRGTSVDERSYSENRRQLSINGTIVVDVLSNGDIMEVKPSSKITEGARLQLLYYLWYLKHVAGDEREGVLAHPTERKRERVVLDPENETRVEEAIDRIYRIVDRDSPPPAEEKPYCDSCAYHDFCWSC